MDHKAMYYRSIRNAQTAATLGNTKMAKAYKGLAAYHAAKMKEVHTTARTR